MFAVAVVSEARIPSGVLVFVLQCLWVSLEAPLIRSKIGNYFHCIPLLLYRNPIDVGVR